MKASRGTSFQATVHNTQIRFTVPIQTLRTLGLVGANQIRLILKSTSGTILVPSSVHPMRSRHEVYGKHLKGKLKHGQNIEGIAFRR